MSFEEMMQQLKSDYLSSLPEKITEIQTRVQEGKVRELREDFHKLKGTGKTYGLPEISQLAEAVEKICCKQPDKAVEASQIAVQLLKGIYEERQSSQIFNLLENENFHKICRIAA